MAENNMPVLPKRLLDEIGFYGYSYLDRVSEVERIHRWDVLIVGIKDYASKCVSAARAEDVEAMNCALTSLDLMQMNYECEALKLTPSQAERMLSAIDLLRKRIES